MEEQYLDVGTNVVVLQEGKIIDSGKILFFSADGDKMLLEFRSNKYETKKSFEFISFSPISLVYVKDAQWFYLFEHPFDPFRKCFSDKGPIYTFRKI